MSRVPDSAAAEAITVVARRVLLDALTALEAHSDAITLVGAQAVHLRTAAGKLTHAGQPDIYIQLAQAVRPSVTRSDTPQ